MAEKKNQHYVPQMYLRNFASGSKKAIHLYNISAKRKISNAPIKGQCAASYFYGKDLKIENALQNIEGLVSKIIRGILDTDTLPKPRSKEAGGLLVFTIFQYARTKDMADIHDDMAEKFIKAVMERDGTIDKELLEKVTIKLTQPTALALDSAAKHFYIAADLKMKLLLNRSDVEFITSDNPVVLYNQIFEPSKPALGSNTGLACKGLQIFLPLSPTHLLVMYDGGTYRIGEKRSDSAIITNPNDVRQFNDLQYLNSFENLYSFSEFSAPELFVMEQRNAGRPRNRKGQLHQYQQPDRPDGKSSVLLHLSKPDHRIKLSIQPIRQLVRLTEAELNAYPKPFRNARFVAMHKEFMEEVKAGNYDVSQMRRFLEDRVKAATD
ncbi:MAG: DUF4238 domain-containing protein [Achromobacter kerstersii]|uniref:DUF4238 domain-containing protein n=1 Tax=Achromobacter kerstersii TaxID=1353890 RepID=UPI003D0258F5